MRARVVVFAVCVSGAAFSQDEDCNTNGIPDAEELAGGLAFVDARVAGGSAPVGVAAGDLDADGQLDLATASVLSDSVSVLLGIGNGTFEIEQPSSYSVGTEPRSITMADLNSDGRLDLATANAGSDDISVLLGSGDGAFAVAQSFDAGDFPVAIAAADFDSDGHLDLATANRFSDDISVLFGVGDGTFQSALQLTAGDGPGGITAADFDADGRIDLATANFFSGDISVFPGVGDGTFGAERRWDAGSDPKSITTADLDGDGHVDLAITNSGSDDVTVRWGQGDGTFATAEPLGVGDRPFSIIAADLNGDGALDLVTANNGSDDVSVLAGIGNGSFEAERRFDTGEEPEWITAGEIDSDGRIDLVTANEASNDLSVLLSQTDCNENGVPDSCDIATGTSQDVNQNGAPDECDSSLEATELRLGVDTPVELTTAEPRRLFRFSAPVGFAVVLTIEDPDSQDANALYVQCGSPPSDTDFDQAADKRFRSDGSLRSSQRLVVPIVRRRPCFALVQANILKSGVNRVTVRAELQSLALEEISVTRAAGEEPLRAAVLGAGFVDGTVFDLIPRAGGLPVRATGVELVSSSRAEMAFDLTGSGPGFYDLVAMSQGGAQGKLQGAFELLATAEGPQIEASLESIRNDVRKYRIDHPSRLTLRYRNTGDVVVTAPLFVITAIDPPGQPPTEFRLAREREFRVGPLQVLGIHPNGVPGELPPGEGWEIPVYFRSSTHRCGKDGNEPCKVTFQLEILTPLDNDYVGWDQARHAASLGIDREAWQEAWPGLSRRFGATWRDYQEGLAALAARISRRGGNAYSVRDLFRFATRDSLGRPSSAVLGRVTLAGSGEVLKNTSVLGRQDGILRSSTTTDSEGRFALTCLPAGETEIAVSGHRIVSLRQGETVLEGSVDVSFNRDSQNLVVLVEPENGGPVEPPVDPPACDESHLPARPPLLSKRALTLLEPFEVEIVSSWDPNEKDGPKGEDRGGLSGLVLPGALMDYTIHFENKPCASAPAQTVVVKNRLDKAIFDVSSLRLRDVRIGTRSDQTVPLDMEGSDLHSGYTRHLGLQRYSAAGAIDVEGEDIRPGSLRELPVEFDVRTAMVETEDSERELLEITWTLTASPDDGLEGFLPPNFTPDCTEICVNDQGASRPCTCADVQKLEGAHPCKDGRGEGSVSFSVNLRDNLPERTRITCQAEIEFDERPLPPEELVNLVWPNEVSHDLSPGRPRKPEPSSGESNLPQDFVLRWEAEGATAYDLFLWPEGSSPELRRENLTDNSIDARELGLEQQTPYRWQVCAINEYGETPGSEWIFSTGPAPGCPPPTPSTPTPRDGAILPDGNPVLSWQVTGAPAETSIGYDLYIWRRGQPRPSEPHAEGLTNTLFDAPLGLAARVTYQWQVVASRASQSGCQAEGPEWTFQVRSFVRGDVNADGRINLTDVISLLSFLFAGGEEPPCLEAADVNDDGELSPPNISDPVFLLGWLFLGSAAPPPPTPSTTRYGTDDCGGGPSGETLGCESFPPCLGGR